MIFLGDFIVATAMARLDYIRLDKARQWLSEYSYLHVRRLKNYIKANRNRRTDSKCELRNPKDARHLIDFYLCPALRATHATLGKSRLGKHLR